MEIEVTQRDVEIYRELYYEYAKPAIVLGYTQEQIHEYMCDAVKIFGWTIEKYRAFNQLDCFQRIEYMRSVIELQGNKNNNLFVVTPTGEPVATSWAYKYPELRCPIRSEEQRNLN